jgi:hypothetical protein
MKLVNSQFRPLGSLLVVLSVAAALTFNSFAAPRTVQKVSPPVADEAASVPSGTLAGSGGITINGNPAQAGATILSGSTIATGADGIASVQIARLGRIGLARNTSIGLTFTENRVEVVINNCGSVSESLEPGVVGVVRIRSEITHFVVTRGRLEVRATDGSHSLSDGEEALITNASEAITSGNSAFSLETCTDVASEGQKNKKPAGGYVNAGAVGVIALATTAGGIALGVMAGQNSRVVAPKASTVVP